VGEDLAEREMNEIEAVLTRQIQADLAEVPDARLSEVVIAYEPIWAIGTGKTATPELAQEAIALIRGLIESRSPEAAAATRILYGGSVKPDNAAELIAQSDIDGALVGGASLDPGDFAAIVEAA
jgi:triosephosphate isomerase